MSGSARATLTGRCNCGAVTFVATGPFRPAKACHCKTCRRQSGHFIAATQIDRAGLTITGAEALTWFAATRSGASAASAGLAARISSGRRAGPIAFRSSWAASTSPPAS